MTLRPSSLKLVGVLLATCATCWLSLRHVQPFWAPLQQQQQSRQAHNQQLHNQGLIEVAYADPATRTFVGAPSIARLDDGTLLVSYHYFGPGSGPHRTVVSASRDGGLTWQERAVVPQQYWSTLFTHGGAVHLLGTDGDDYGAPNAVSVARSTDGGATWNRSAVLPAPPGCRFASGVVPVAVQRGWLFRGVEFWCGPQLHWPQDYRAQIVAAPAGADLLDPSVWRVTAAVPFNSTAMLPRWFPEPVVSGGFLEGNAVGLPDGTGVALLLRCLPLDAQGRLYSTQHACLFHLELPPAELSSGSEAAPGGAAPDRAAQPLPPEPLAPAAQRRRAAMEGQQGPGAASIAVQQQQQPGEVPLGPLRWQGFVSMPGGGVKFVVRRDPATGLYLSLTNPSIDRYGPNPDARNILTLVFSPNLLDWRIATTVLVPNDGLSWEQSLWSTGYQYVDWIADGDDLLLAIRTAWNGANTYHNSNFITFKRVRQYRQYLPGGGGPGMRGRSGETASAAAA